MGTKADLISLEEEDGVIYTKTFDTLPDDSPVYKGVILRVTEYGLVIGNEEYFYDITMKKQMDT